MSEIAIMSRVKPRIAFLGTGWIGLNRMSALLKENICKPVAILEPTTENAMRARQIAPDATIFHSLEDLIESEPDGIVIASPSALHAKQAITALQNGIPVFVQKPLGRNSNETLQVIKAARNADKLLGMDLSYRFTDGMQQIQKITAAHELGSIYAIDLIYNSAYAPDKEWSFNPQLSGGGCLIDLGIHLIDLAMWILNFPEVENFHSTLYSHGKRITSEVALIAEDYVSTQFETKDGIMIRLVCSWNLPEGKDVEIKASFYGTKSSVQFYNVNGNLYDFETALCHGSTKTIISSPPDDWGGKALINWTRTLQKSRCFRDEAMQYYCVAEILDQIYKRKNN